MNNGRAPKILFVCYGGGHIAMILPLMRALREMKPEAELVLMALTIAGKAARDAGETPLGFADFTHLRDRDRVLAHGRRLLGTATGGIVSEAESLAYLGISYSELEDVHGSDGAEELFEEKGRAAFYPLAFMQDVIAEVAPDVVVTTNSPRGERAAREAASAIGLPCVALNDLLPVQATEFVGRESWPDKICVLSQRVADYLATEGAPAGTVTVTGNPAFDALVAPHTQKAAKEMVALRKWEGLKPILFCCDVDIFEKGEARYTLLYRMVDVLLDYINARPDTALILRYHPSRWMDMKRPEPHPRVHFTITPEEPPHPQILSSSVVLAQYSTLALEASIAGKPVISLEKLMAGKSVMSWEDEGISVGCSDLADLPTMLDHVLKEQSQQQGPKITDGRASFRVGETILSLI